MNNELDLEIPPYRCQAKLPFLTPVLNDICFRSAGILTQHNLTTLYIFGNKSSLVVLNMRNFIFRKITVLCFDKIF